MGRGGGAKRAPNTSSGSNNAISLREELTGRTQTKGGSVNAKSALKLEHLQRLAVWAGVEASIPSFGAFFGHRLASGQEALGVPPDPSLFPCQRCETILQPAFNCTVRIEKNRAHARHRSKKPTSLSQNNVVCTCHLCSHMNLKRGTPKGNVKGMCPPKTKTISKFKPAESMSMKFVSSNKSIVAEDKVRQANELASLETVREIHTVESPAGKEEVGKENDISSSEIAGQITIVHKNPAATVEDEGSEANEIVSSAIAREMPTVENPATPMVRTGTMLLAGKRRKRNRSASKKPAVPENSPNPIDAENTVSTSNKRKRKSWTSLKKIAESFEQNSIRNITIPFVVKGA